MRHPDDGALRAHLDRELDAPAEGAVAAHVAGCADCRARLATLERRSAASSAFLAALEPRAVPSPDAVRACLDARLVSGTRPGAVPQLRKGGSIMQMRHAGSRRQRRVAALAAAVALVVGLAALQPVRALAGQVLALFRVQRVTVLPIDEVHLDALGSDAALGRAVGQLFADSVEVIHEPGPSTTVATADEAAGVAGFTPRLPDRAPAELGVQDGAAFAFTINHARAQGILDSLSAASEADGGIGPAEMDAIELPPSIDGATVSVSIPKAVLATYGDCPSLHGDAAGRSNEGEIEVFGEGGSAAGDAANGSPGPEVVPADPRATACLMLAQMPSPEVVAPPELDVAQLAELGMRFMGFSAVEAKLFSRTVDWTSTLVVPVPRGSVSSRPMTVDGADGVVLEPQRRHDGQAPDFTILWARDGGVYMLVGDGVPVSAGRALADALP